MKIAICEDLHDDLYHLHTILNDYLNAHGLAADVDCFRSGEAFLEAFKPGKYQIIFMDIFMSDNGLTGMETAEKIRETDSESAVILTTTSLDYAIAGYNVAVYYIVKPITETDLTKAMQKCRAQIDRFGKSIEVTVNRQPVTIPLHHIYYMEAMQRNSVFVTTGGKFIAQMTFDKLTKTFSELPFLQCHRSYIVNLAHVRDMQDKDFIINETCKVPISRACLPAARRKFQQFLADELRGEYIGR